jgi:hypothetical protein
LLSSCMLHASLEAQYPNLLQAESISVTDIHTQRLDRTYHGG